MRQRLITTLLLLFASAQTAAAPVTFVYDDLDGFAAAVAAIDDGAEPQQAFAAYIENATPAMQIFVERFGVSAQTLASRFERFPNFYRHVAALRPRIEAREEAMQVAMAKLATSAPDGARTVPVYFLVGNMAAGGNPGMVETPQGMRPVIGIAIEMMAMTPAVDLSEFPDGPVGVDLADLPYVAVHEMSHIFQMQRQGLPNYLSIYTNPERGTNLAFAIREGCADFLATRALGQTLAGRQAYVAEHEAALWQEFQPVLHAPVDRASGWFGGRSATHPDWPMQVGYGVGMAACRTYHAAAADKSAGLDMIYRAHLPEHYATIVAPYAARFE